MSENTTQAVRIESIRVTKLFGLYDHSVTLKTDRVTVIHGPNGVGKTVFLKLTNAFLRGRYFEIARIRFSTFVIEFSDKSRISIDLFLEEGNSQMMKLSFITWKGEKDFTILESDLLNSLKLAHEVADNVPYLAQTGPEEWIDRRTDEILNADEVLAAAMDYMPKMSSRWASREPKGLRELRSRINVHLIEAQRLIRVSQVSAEFRFRSNPDYPTRNTVQAYSKDLKRKLESALANYAKHSQKLDQTFPQRLLQGGVKHLTLDQLKTQLQEVDKIRSNLKSMGILEVGDVGPEFYPLQVSELDKLDANQLPVLSVYASDTKAKLTILEDLSGKIELFLNILNRKFTNKRVMVSRESGLAVVGTDGNLIPITSLSSGEQHEIVLLYDLLFKVRSNSLILIDEPELSLHISWQKTFMDDLLSIIEIADFDVLMATHSPYIVGEHSDLLEILSTEVK